MNSTHPVASGAASGGVAGAAVVILSWGLSLVHVTVPAEVAASAMVAVAPVLHFLLCKYGLDDSGIPAAVVPAVVPAGAKPA